MRIKNSCEQMILICPVFFDYHLTIIQGLCDKGFKVFYINDRVANHSILKALIRLNITLIYGIITNVFFLSLIFKLPSQAKYIFLVNPEATPFWFLKFLKKKYGCPIVVYFWDSFENKKHHKSYLRFADYAYSFDMHDCRNQSHLRMNYLPLFCSDSYLNRSLTTIEYDLSFIGSWHSDRHIVLEEILKFSQENNLRLYIFLYFHSKLYYWIRCLIDPKIKKIEPAYVSFDPLPLDECYNMMRKSKVILDIHHPTQNGLTMRAMESLGLNRRIITTNSRIFESDLFYEHNVTVIDRKHPRVDPAFFEFDLEQVKAKRRMDIDEWLSSVLVLAKEK